MDTVSRHRVIPSPFRSIDALPVLLYPSELSS